MKTGTLYVVATPIGNLDDITIRALDVLRQVHLIACEDTRRSRTLLSRYRIGTRLMSLHRFSESRKVESVLGKLMEGKSVALISDAGTPAISDPGDRLVDAALNAGFPVTPIPGPSSITAALSVSGVDASTFCYLGFVPRKETARADFFDRVLNSVDPAVFFESPRRIKQTLAGAAQILGQRRLTLIREMTKLHEEILRGTAADILELLDSRESVKGEIIVIAERAAPHQTSIDVESAVKRLMDEGFSGKHLAREALIRFGIKKKLAYDAFLKATGETREREANEEPE